MLPTAVDGLYDALVDPRANRVDLPLLAPQQPPDWQNCTAQLKYGVDLD